LGLFHRIILVWLTNGIGSVSEIHGKSKDSELNLVCCKEYKIKHFLDNVQVFYTTETFLSPSVIYRIHFVNDKPETEILSETKLGEIDPNDYIVQQIFYLSKDGTRIPMFLHYKKVILVVKFSQKFIRTRFFVDFGERWSESCLTVWLRRIRCFNFAHF